MEQHLEGAAVSEPIPYETLPEAIARLEAENERLEEYVVAHTLVERGVVDFDLHAETVERFRRAQEACADVVCAALAADTGAAAEEEQ
jgi:hypothetical protein